jgi:hypothetical protein
MKLVRNDIAFKWEDKADRAFVRLKKMFTTAPVLALFDAERETIMETDASKWCVGGTLY